MTPRIETERLALRPFTRDDAADVFAYGRNPNVSRYTVWETHRSIEDAVAFIERLLVAPADHHTWAIRQRGEPAAIGAIELSVHSPDEAQIHYVLDEPFWNRGLMSEAARAVTSWGWATYPVLRRISSSARAENVGSLRVMEKCGLAFERSVEERWDKVDANVTLHEHAAYRQPR
jgi:ribosomal-protein-alanine N-acetyltransferase